MAFRVDKVWFTAEEFVKAIEDKLVLAEGRIIPEEELEKVELFEEFCRLVGLTFPVISIYLRSLFVHFETY